MSRKVQDNISHGMYYENGKKRYVVDHWLTDGGKDYYTMIWYNLPISSHDREEYRTMDSLISAMRRIAPISKWKRAR